MSTQDWLCVLSSPTACVCNLCCAVLCLCAASVCCVSVVGSGEEREQRRPAASVSCASSLRPVRMRCDERASDTDRAKQERIPLCDDARATARSLPWLRALATGDPRARRRDVWARAVLRARFARLVAPSTAVQLSPSPASPSIAISALAARGRASAAPAQSSRTSRKRTARSLSSAPHRLHRFCVQRVGELDVDVVVTRPSKASLITSGCLQRKRHESMQPVCRAEGASALAARSEPRRGIPPTDGESQRREGRSGTSMLPCALHYMLIRTGPSAFRSKRARVTAAVHSALRTSGTTRKHETALLQRSCTHATHGRSNRLHTLHSMRLAISSRGLRALRRVRPMVHRT